MRRFDRKTCLVLSEKPARGFTLIEFLIAATILVMMLLAALLVFNQNVKMKHDTEALLEAQQQARIGIQAIADRLRMAGYGNIPLWAAVNGAPPIPSGETPCIAGANTSVCFTPPGSTTPMKTDAIRVFAKYQENSPDFTVADCQGSGNPNCQGMNGTNLDVVHPSGICKETGGGGHQVDTTYLGQTVMICNIATNQCQWAQITDSATGIKCAQGGACHGGTGALCWDDIDLSCTGQSWSGAPGENLTAEAGVQMIEFRLRQPAGVQYPQLEMCVDCWQPTTGGCLGSGGEDITKIALSGNDADWIPIADNIVNFQIKFAVLDNSGSYLDCDGNGTRLCDDDDTFDFNGDGENDWDRVRAAYLYITARTKVPMAFITAPTVQEKYRDILIQSEILFRNLLWRGT